MANGQLVGENNIQTTPPSWQHPVLPAPATQGNILMTVNPFITPPEDSSNFKWLPMEDIIGTADVKMEYDDTLNHFNFYKAKGHLDNNGEWHYNWELFATVVGLTEATQQALQELIYVSYEYDTSVANTLKVSGVLKSGEKVLLCDIEFVSATVLQQAITNLTTLVNQQQVKEGIATTLTQEVDGRKVNVAVDNESIIVNTNNVLKANIINDNLNTATDKTWSIDKIKQYAGADGFHYIGEVASKTNLPTTNVNVGDTYSVINENDLYVYIGNNNWKAFTEVYEAYNTGAITLTKSTNGTYATLHYDNIDFAIDNLNNLKSQIIDDSIGGADSNAERKTYSITKILQLLASCEYVAGAGIVINGKTITATGISFIVGNGLAASGTGTTTTLYTKNGNGIQYDINNAIEVKSGNAITVDGNGVGVNTGNTITTDSNTNALEVNFGAGLKNQTTTNELTIKDGKGIITDTNGININTNLNIKSTPLGTQDSKIALYSDGKIGVDFTETPVVLTGEVIWESGALTGNIEVSNVSLPAKIKDFDLYYIEAVSYNSAGQLLATDVGKLLFIKKDVSQNINVTETIPASATSGGNVPVGMGGYCVYINGIYINNQTIKHIGYFHSNSQWLPLSSSWAYVTGNASYTRYGFRISGIKAR